MFLRNLISVFIAVAFCLTGCKKDEEKDQESSSVVVNGCMDANATNYNAEATNDDGSCTFPTPKNLFYSDGDWIPSNHEYGEISIANTDSKTVLGTITVAKNKISVTCEKEIADSTILRLLEPGVHNYRVSFQSFFWDYYEPGNEASAYMRTSDEGSKDFQLDIPSNKFYCETYNITK